MPSISGLTCKHIAANAEQRANLILCCQIGKKMGATDPQIAGAMATMIQESNAHNYLSVTDGSGSAGLYMQRVGFGWGTYKEIITPSYAVARFYRTYLPYCRQGHSPIDASNLTQRSAYPTAPAAWLSESTHNVSLIMHAKGFSTDVTSSGGGSGGSTKTITRNQPYEFSRGSPGQPETSWDCMGRLASEVNWDRFMRGGVLWFVSEDWLKNQPARFQFAEGARGVLEITFDADTRLKTSTASEMTVTAIAKRWQVLPGDHAKVVGQGPADGNWLVSDTQRSLWNDTTTITLKRPTPKLPEPAPQTETKTINVGGSSAMNLGNTSSLSGVKGLAGKPIEAVKVYLAAKKISDKNYPYVYAGGHPTCCVPNGGGYCCSGYISACLAMANVGGFRCGGPSMAGNFVTWGQPGLGKHFTVWVDPTTHVWMQFHGFPMWRADTSPAGCPGPSGPHLRPCPRPVPSYGGEYFYPRHWPGL
jgi:hypothetical protein